MEGKRERARYVEHEWSQMNVDHIKPKSNGGSDMMINYQLTCYPCNSMKGNRVLQ